MTCRSTIIQCACAKVASAREKNAMIGDGRVVWARVATLERHQGITSGSNSVPTGLLCLIPGDRLHESQRNTRWHYS